VKNYYILAINPGSTSTKTAIFKNDKSVFTKEISHSSEDLAGFEKIADQFRFRKELILKEIESFGFDINNLSAVVGRGGLIKPVESGVYEVNDAMLKDLDNSSFGEHASNLGAIIASDIAGSVPGARALTADPIVVDEMKDVARLSGHPEIDRISIFHALNQKAAARAFAEKKETSYEKLNLVVAHMGGGISVGAHEKGKVVDVNNAIDGDGPFSPERSGSLPCGILADFLFEKNLSKKEVRSMIQGKGGLTAYLGTNDVREAESMAAKGDDNAKKVLEAMAYQVGKEIGSAAAVLKGDVDAVILTGGIAKNSGTVEAIKEMTQFIAPVEVYPGEDELKALALNGLRVLKKETELKIYK
jgi:butyrate kinase